MDKLRLEVLTKLLLAAAAALALAACGRPDELPLPIYVEDSWSDEETAQIRLAIDEWNAVAAAHLKEPQLLLDYRGRIHDAFEPEDFGDDIHVIYRIGSPEQVPEFLRSEPPGGYGTFGDILLFTFNLCPDCDQYPDFLRIVSLHELGHFIGLPHLEHRPAIMKPGWDDRTEHLTEGDIEAFCIAYECK